MQALELDSFVDAHSVNQRVCGHVFWGHVRGRDVATSTNKPCIDELLITGSSI